MPVGENSIPTEQMEKEQIYAPNEDESQAETIVYSFNPAALFMWSLKLLASSPRALQSETSGVLLFLSLPSLCLLTPAQHSHLIIGCFVSLSFISSPLVV